MSNPLRSLNRASLQGLAAALESTTSPAALSRDKIAPLVSPNHLDAVCLALGELAADGMANRHLGRMLRLIAEERASAQRLGDRLELVWTPRDLDLVHTRDTAVVARELFRAAERSVLVATYVLDAKQKAEALFGELAGRMDAEPGLIVRFVVNVERPYKDTTTPRAELLAHAARRLREEVWPGKRLPEFYYDPRALEDNPHERASMHAKCIVVDRCITLLTSANLTEAAHARNIEAGVRVEDAGFAERVESQFLTMVERGWLCRV